MPYLLDTCLVSELRKPRCNAGVSLWMASISADEAFLSVLNLGEIRRGIERLRSKDAKQAGALERWLRELEDNFRDRILPVSASVADQWGRLCLEQPLPVSDGLIAATALVHRLTVVTRNVADFQRSGALTLNPFT